MEVHTPKANLTFGQALENLKMGHTVAREGWNGRDMYLELQTPDENSKMQRSYIYIVPGNVAFTVPWVASQADLLTDDWYVVSTPVPQL